MRFCFSGKKRFIIHFLVLFLATNISCIANALEIVPMLPKDGKIPTIEEYSKSHPNYGEYYSTEKNKYEAMVTDLLEMAEQLPAGSPEALSLPNKLLRQISELPKDQQPDLQKTVNDHYVERWRNSSEHSKISPSQFGFESPSSSFLERFKKWESETGGHGLGDNDYNQTNLEQGLQLMSTAPESLRASLFDRLDIFRLDPKYFDSVSQWAKRYIGDDETKRSMASRMLAVESRSNSDSKDDLSISNFSYLEFLEKNKTNNSNCQIMDLLKNLKATGRLAKLPEGGPGRIHLRNYLQGLPAKVSCSRFQKEDEVFDTQDEIRSLGPLPLSSNGQKPNLRGMSVFDLARECPLTDSMIDSVIKGSDSVLKGTHKRFASANGVPNCSVVAKLERVNQIKGPDKFNVELIYSIRGESLPIDIKNPLTKAEVIELGKAWQAYHKGSAPVAPASSAPASGLSSPKGAK